MDKPAPPLQLFLWGIIMVLLLASIVVSITSIAVDIANFNIPLHGQMFGPLSTELVLLVIYGYTLVRYMGDRRRRGSSTAENNPHPRRNTLRYYYSLFSVALTVLLGFLLLSVSASRLLRYGLSPSQQCRTLYYDSDGDVRLERAAREGITCSMWVAQLWMGVVTSLAVLIDTFLHGCKSVPRPTTTTTTVSSYEMAPPPPQYHYAPSPYPNGPPGPYLPPSHQPPPPPGPSVAYWQQPPPPAPGFAPTSTQSPFDPPSYPASSSQAPSMPPPPAPQEALDIKRS